MTSMPPDRLLIFGDPTIGFAGVLLQSFLAELTRRGDVTLVGVVDTGRRRPAPEPLRIMASEVRLGARNLFSPEDAASGGGTGFQEAARRFGVPVSTPPGRDINHPAFLEQLRTRWRPSLALSVGCLQILQPATLDAFEMAVNYHDGILPGYGGLAATAWSLYRRGAVTGYTYHRMDPGIDTGPVLVQGAVEADGTVPARWIRDAKAERAARDAAVVLDCMVGRDPGRPQAAGGSYFSRRDYNRIRRIDDPSTLDAAEILHRLRCFEVLTIRICGRPYEVTSLRDADPSGRLSFLTRDGQRLAVHRAMYLPPSLYRVYRHLRARTR